MPTPAPPADDPLTQGREQLDRATRGEKDKTLGRKTMLMPLQLFVVTTFVMPQDDARQGPPSAVPLWSEDELRQSLVAADGLMQRCFGVKLRWDAPRKVDLSTAADASLANFPIADPRDLRNHAARLQRSFDVLVSRAVPALPRQQRDVGTHALFVNRIFDGWREEHVNHPERSTTVGLSLPADSDDVEERSNRVVVGYLQDHKRRRDARDSRQTAWVPASPVDARRAGAVLAHEIGHSLGLEHDETTVGGRKNLMSATIDEPPPGAAEPVQLDEYSLAPEDAEAARANGLASGRLR